jgi:hypothetical protein
LVSSGSLQDQGSRRALYLMLLIGISATAAAEVVRGDVAPGELYRLEDGVLVIDWSPEIEFFSNFTLVSDNSSIAETVNRGLNGSLGVPLQPKNASPGSDQASASLSLAESGTYDGAASGAHLGWASWDPETGGKGRHTEYGRRVTDLVGIFSIEMNIKLGSNLSSSPGTAEWIPCP